jgi:tetratricopeptide (TPR) repeat protein
VIVTVTTVTLLSKLDKVKQPQWITLFAAAILTIAIFFFGRTVSDKKIIAESHTENDGHIHEGSVDVITIDTILAAVRKRLTADQSARLSMIENSISRGAVKDQQVKVYHQLAHFWGDSMGFFPAYAWYQAEAARLENSEKSLTFAAHLFLNNLQQGQAAEPAMIRWQGSQAKDLFERSLKINPDNDSSKVGLGACYLFGNISSAPMEGIAMIREVVAKDSTNTFAQMMLVEGSLLSGQFDKAIDRLNAVCRMHPDNVQAVLMLADAYERTNEKALAVNWYRKSLLLVKRPDLQEAITKRIAELEK